MNTLNKCLALALIFCLSLPSILNAQSKAFYGNEVAISSRSDYDAQFADFQVFEIDAAALAAHLNEPRTASRVQLQLGRSFDWDLVLFENDLRGSDYQMRIASERGVEIAPPRENITFAGHPADGSGEVRLTISDGFIFGYVEQNEERFFIEPARRFDRSATNNQFIVYSTGDVLPRESVKCGVTDMHKVEVNRVELDENDGSRVACKELQLAIASDLSMYTKFNSDAPALEAYAFGVMNGVETDYTGQFNDDVDFIVVEFFVSTSSGTDPVSSATTNSSTVLCDFRNWGNAGGFTNSHDLGQFWTDRDFDGTTIGVAYTGGLCSTAFASGCSGLGDNGYHILQDFESTNACETQALVSHEIGHNFDASHDNSGDPYIMAPSVQCITDWSSASQTSINSHLGSIGCLSTCTNTYGAPVAQFVANSTVACNGTAITFTDLSSNVPSSWNWTFTGGSPSSSTSQNPTVSYSTNGTYEVSLTATNSMGSDSETKTGYITVVNAVDAATTPNDASSGTGGIFGVRLNGMLVFSDGTSTEGTYEDFTCGSLAKLEVSTTYDLYANVGPRVGCGSGTFEAVRAYIDYNGDGDFADTDESIGTTLSSAYCGEIAPISFTTPASPSTNELLRMRLISENAFFSDDPNYDPSQGQVEDFTVFFEVALPVELVRFEGQLKGEQVALQWATATEQNNDFFTLERSTDGEQFFAIAEIDGAGDSFVPLDYQYWDTKPQLGLNYYRLRQTDFDGSSTLSDIVVIDYQPKSRVVVQPNPFSSAGFQLSYLSQTEVAIDIEVIDITGRVVYRAIEAVGEGMNNFQLATNAWSPGVYILRLRQGEWETNQRLLKQ